VKKPKKNTKKSSKSVKPKPMDEHHVKHKIPSLKEEKVFMVDGRKLEAEPRYIVDGKITDAPFHNEMLKSEEGNRLSDQLAIKTAMETLGLSRKEAMKFMGMTPGEFSEHEYPPIDLERGKEGNKQAEQVDPKFRALMDKLRAEAKKFGRTID
jgi:hypothetical protein